MRKRIHVYVVHAMVDRNKYSGEVVDEVIQIYYLEINKNILFLRLFRFTPLHMRF
jgi:hypothetical protein